MSARHRIQSLVYKRKYTLKIILYLETPAPVLPPVQMHEKRFAGFIIIFAL